MENRTILSWLFHRFVCVSFNEYVDSSFEKLLCFSPLGKINSILELNLKILIIELWYKVCLDNILTSLPGWKCKVDSVILLTLYIASTCILRWLTCISEEKLQSKGRKFRLWPSWLEKNNTDDGTRKTGFSNKPHPVPIYHWESDYKHNQRDSLINVHDCFCFYIFLEHTF